MRQYVLTRSAYGPAWDLGANRRRLAISAAVTARSLGAQTVRDWTWIVLLDPRDPLLAERTAVYRAAVPSFVPFVWRPAVREARGHALRQRIAAADYRAPWREVVGPADETVLMARLDDDDGLAPDALARFRAAGEGRTRRTILMLPEGVWTWRGRYSPVRHERNAMHTLVTPPGDRSVVYDYSHTKAATFAPVVMVDERWGWLWPRHGDTISGARNPRQWGPAPVPLVAAVRDAFPIDWEALARAWA